MGLGCSRLIRFVFKAAAWWKGVKGTVVCFAVKRHPKNVCGFYPTMQTCGRERSCLWDVCVFHLSFWISFSPCGGRVKGWWVRWSQQEATSAVWCLTRTDCMTDGFPGRTALAWRSGSVRAFSGLSPPGGQSTSNTGWTRRGGGSNCKSNWQVILPGVPLLLFMQNFPFYSPFLRWKLPCLSSFFGSISGEHFLSWGGTDTAGRKEQTGQQNDTKMHLMSDFIE